MTGMCLLSVSVVAVAVFIVKRKCGPAPIADTLRLPMPRRRYKIYLWEEFGVFSLRDEHLNHGFIWDMESFDMPEEYVHIPLNLDYYLKSSH